MGNFFGEPRRGLCPWDGDPLNFLRDDEMIIIIEFALFIRDRKGTPKNFCDKDFAERSGELSGAICPRLVQKVLWCCSCDSLVLVFCFWPLILIVPKRCVSRETPRQQTFESAIFIVEKICCHCAGSYKCRGFCPSPRLQEQTVIKLRSISKAMFLCCAVFHCAAKGTQQTRSFLESIPLRISLSTSPYNPS